MAIPKKVVIAPYTIGIETPTILPEAVGHAPSDFSIVQVSLNQTEDMMKSTLVHEILHTIIGQGLRPLLKEADAQLEEQVVAYLEPRILALIKDNKALTKYLQEDN